MDVDGLCNGLNGFKQPNLINDVLLLKFVFSHHAFSRGGWISCSVCTFFLCDFSNACVYNLSRSYHPTTVMTPNEEKLWCFKIVVIICRKKILNKKVKIPGCFSSDSRIISVSRSNQILNSVILYGSNMHNEVKPSQPCPTIAQLLWRNCEKRIKKNQFLITNFMLIICFFLPTKGIFHVWYIRQCWSQPLINSSPCFVPWNRYQHNPANN